ncbi:TPA: amidinotransferase [Thermoplasmata archaeon]|nr:amidinotransferase [Thermoplasmata archaeon]
MIDVGLAKEQHRIYCSTLRDLGLEVLTLPLDEGHPDACFVEDTAVIHGRKALICRAGVECRRGEETPVVEALGEYLQLRRAVAPATIEGGDVVHFEDRLLSGVSQRTNLEGVRQLSEWLEVQVDTVDDSRMMHLKSHVTYLGNNIVIATEKYAGHPSLKGREVIVIPPGEEYAADTLAVDDTVLMASGYPRSHDLVRLAGFRVIPLDVSEMEKCDGALTCLSLLF